MAQGVVLGADGRPMRRDRARMFVPAGMEDKPLFGACNICGAKFFRGQERVWERHVGECYRANEARVRAESPAERHRGTVFDPQSWDPEVDAHMAKVRARMEAEGRWEIKPEERAGFS